PRGKRVFHPFMPHCNPVTDANNAESKRHATGSSNSFTHLFRELAQVGMAGHDGIVRIGNTAKRERHLPLGHPQRSQKRTVWRPFVPFLDPVTSQIRHYMMITLHDS